MMVRSPWTEPYTIRERVELRWSLKKYDATRFVQAGLWQWLANRLPRRLVLFAFVRVVAAAWVETNKSPDEITYSEAYKRWEGDSSTT